MEKIHWAPKIRQALIWQLYQNDSLGTIDEALIEDVGYRLYQRCNSIRLVTRREVECPRCATIFTLCEPGSWKMLSGVLYCPGPGCGWETTAAEWHATWRHQDLLGTAALAAVETYLHDYPLARARGTEHCMVCIDQLIHAFHISLKTGTVSRSFANNLIEGSHEQVVALLDRLFEKSDGVDKDRWRADIDDMWNRRRGNA
jgi:hypothetical protein